MEQKEHNRKKKLTPEKIQILDKLKKLRTGKNLSQSQIAKLIDISQAAYAKIESGDTFDITIDIGKGIAKALGMSFNELFEIETIKNKEQEDELKAEIERLSEIIKEQKGLISILKEQNEILKPFRIAFIQERSISELMVYATIERMKELAKSGGKIEMTSFEVRQAAIEIYKKEYPDIELNPYLFLTPGESKKKQ